MKESTTTRLATLALLAMTLHEMGHEAVSFTGSQAGIVTDTTGKSGSGMRP